MAEATKSRSRWRMGLHERLGALFFFFILITGLFLALTGYRMMVKDTTAAVGKQADSLTGRVKSHILHTLRRPIQPLVDAMAHGMLQNCHTLAARLDALPLLTSVLENHPIIGGINASYTNGDYFLVRRLVPNGGTVFTPPKGSAFVVFSVMGTHASFAGERLFYSADLRLLHRENAGEIADFDPRKTPWFQSAMTSTKMAESSPRIPHSVEQPIMVFAQRFSDGSGVVGVEILLPQLSAALARELPTPDSRLALFRPDGTLLAHSQGLLHPQNGESGPYLRTREDLALVMQRGLRAYQYGIQGRGLDFSDGERDWQVSIEEFRFKGAVGEVMILAIPDDELRAEGMAFLRHALLGIFGILAVCAPLIWLTARRISRPLRNLAASAGNLQDFVLEDKAVDSALPEIQALAGSMRYIQEKIRKILTINLAISSERNFDQLLETMARETVSLVMADGCLVAALDEEKEHFTAGVLCWGRDGSELIRPIGGGLMRRGTAQVSYRAVDENRVVRDTVTRSDPRSRNFTLSPAFVDPQVLCVDMVGLPLRDRMGERLGVLSLFKTVRAGGQGFRSAEVAFVESFASTIATALENQNLLKAQSALRDSLIRILAGAIDAKSPYTGGHCERVPIIFQMILEAACTANAGPFKDFSLDANGWEEARLAGWLHDCGKVTTPEYVMDKATKLETLHDRIHEIRTRFEVLKRDAEIAMLRAVAAGADQKEETRRLAENLRELDEDFAFVAACNAGAERMQAADLERLERIAGRTWVRTLDKRLGISRDERARMDAAPPQPLPVREPLLMDNVEHIIPRGAKDILPADNPWGFTVNPPEALYNRGELYNLRIRSGTLTEEERYKINDHITRTIIMLEAMPLPKHLRNVPEIAGAHHETMDGKGYPRGLRREGMSWCARMMAVADIFEALTASDRPYKESKTLRESLEIMEGFRRRNHIDSDVYELFLASGVPERYAYAYLKPEQNDL